jgi:hypothetical protein
LQKEVFDQELQKAHITALKQMVVNEDGQEEKIINKGLDFEAFKELLKKYNQKMKGQICWQMLKHFGYTSTLEISRPLWDDNSISDEILRTARSFELTLEALTFLRKIFKSHSKVDSSGKEVLDQQAIDKIFSTCIPDDGQLFNAQEETQFENYLSCELWIGLWQKAFCENPKVAFRFLIYIGYRGGFLKNVIKPIHTRTKDILGQGNQHRRLVYNCFVVGNSQAGKTAFLDSILGRADRHQPNQEHRFGFPATF